MKNYYEILEVNNKASLDIIKKVFKLQVKKYHPDIVSEDKKEFAENKVKDLNEAYDILSDEVKRKEYDELLNEEINNTFVNNNQLLYEIEDLKQKLAVKEQIIEHFLGDLDLSEYNNSQNSYHEKYKYGNENYDINQKYNNFEKQSDEYGETNNNFNFFKWTIGKDETFTSYYLRVFISFLIRILFFIIFLIIIFAIVSIFTGTNVFEILINVFFS